MKSPTPPRQLPTAIIYDMDGVLADTQKLHYKAEIVTCKHFSIPITMEDLEAEAGRPDSQSFRKFADKYLGDPSIGDAMFAYKNTTAMPAIIRREGVPKVDGARELVTYTAEHFPCAIASSSLHRFITLIMEATDFGDLLPVRISAEDLPFGRGKPLPDIYLLAAEKLHVDPKQCWAIEDAMLGVRAAKAAGMTCIGYRNPGSGNQDLSEADMVVENMRDVVGLLRKKELKVES